MTTIYDVLRRPLVTEKSSYQSGKLNQYTFEVTPDATRTMVKDAIESIYDVTVERVNIINAAAKRSRRAKSRRLQAQIMDVAPTVLHYMNEPIPADMQGKVIEA